MLKVHFWVQADEKKTGDENLTNRFREVGAKSSAEDTEFSFWFYLMNLHSLGVDVYRNDQGTMSKKKAD